MDRERHRMVIRPLSSRRGTMSLLVCLIIGLVMLGLSLALRWAGIMKARELVMMTWITAPIVGLGLLLYLVFPKARLIFDSRSQTVTIRSYRRPDRSIPFASLQPFLLVEMVRAYAHQYYCRNNSFGEFSDLFFSVFYRRTRRQAERLASLCQSRLIDLDGRTIV